MTFIATCHQGVTVIVWLYFQEILILHVLIKTSGSRVDCLLLISHTSSLLYGRGPLSRKTPF